MNETHIYMMIDRMIKKINDIIVHGRRQRSRQRKTLQKDAREAAAERT